MDQLSSATLGSQNQSKQKQYHMKPLLVQTQKNSLLFFGAYFQNNKNLSSHLAFEPKSPIANVCVLLLLNYA
jgi:hypothetical protein